MIRSVIFDLGNVLINYDPRKAGLRFAKDCRVPIVKVLAHFFASPMERAYTCGEVTSRQFYEYSKQALKFSADYRTFSHYWNDIFEENPGMEHLLRKLKKHYPLYLISNTNQLHFDYLLRHYPHIFRHFKKTFPSHRVGCRKPDREIYDTVLKAIKLRPEETVFIDDVAKFVRGARRAGMYAVRFSSLKRLERDLGKLGIRL